MLNKFIHHLKSFKHNEFLLKKLKSQFKEFNNLDKSKKMTNNWSDIYPCLYDSTPETVFDAHYVYHPAWAIRIVKEIAPEYHVDISSTLHFCAMLSAFIPVKFYDYRPAKLTLSDLSSGRADLTNLHFETNSIKSLSCLHTVEHIGLGRYGDPLDPDGDIKAIEELKRVTSIGGSLLFVTPVGIPKIMFNAHRIYSPQIIIDLFKGFSLKKFSLVTDESEFIEDANLEIAGKQNYGCGCFWFQKDN